MQDQANAPRRVRIEPRPAELVAGAGEDHDAVLAIRADLGKRAHELDLRVEIPLQRPVVGVQHHLQNTAAPLHLDETIARAVVIELRH